MIISAKIAIPSGRKTAMPNTNFKTKNSIAGGIVEVFFSNLLFLTKIDSGKKFAIKF
jgi:hypothetical protein